jgi:hypothetical protein
LAGVVLTAAATRMSGQPLNAQTPDRGLPGPGGTLVGLALDASNRPLPDTRVQLRGVRSGNVEATATTGADGGFTFPGLLPGLYVVEMTVTNGSIVAISDSAEVVDGRTVQQNVQLVARSRSFGWWLGSTTTLALAQAASLGVLAVDGGQPVSPQ